MRVRFDSEAPLIYVRGRLWGPDGEVASVRFALDTGATQTTFDEGFLRWLGYSIPSAQAEVLAFPGPANLSEVEVLRFEVFRRTRRKQKVLSTPFDWRLPAHGLLGLDFLRAYDVRIDFRNGMITLS